MSLFGRAGMVCVIRRPAQLVREGSWAGLDPINNLTMAASCKEDITKSFCCTMSSLCLHHVWSWICQAASSVRPHAYACD